MAQKHPYGYLLHLLDRLPTPSHAWRRSVGTPVQSSAPLRVPEYCYLCVFICIKRSVIPEYAAGQGIGIVVVK